MSESTITEGYTSFTCDTVEPCQTFYKKVQLTTSTVGDALIIVHGGPTFGHNYLLSLQSLVGRAGVQCVIFYDQIGCGKSSMVPEKKRDRSFWTLDLFRRQLSALINDLDGIAPEVHGRYHLLGHSVGALLAAQFAATAPPLLQKLILSNGMASIRLLNEASRQILARYPAHVRDSIVGMEEYNLGLRSECRVTQDEYLAALQQCRKDVAIRRPPPFAAELLASLQNVHEAMDTLIALAGGQVEMFFGGSLQNEDVTPVLPNITVPTLVLNGEWDKATPATSQPFQDLIPGAKRIIMRGTSHFPFIEAEEEYIQLVVDFLQTDKN